ncbi:IclR family transcriptional regulator [Naumannella halotolerans]|uniref:IclR family transcriptional regulator n=1 Tax=Naumannella halotolerans TaxID=993414 RepID=UPI00370DA84F
MEQRAPAAAQALTLLTLLARRAEPQPAARLAVELGMPRSSTYHLLKVLIEHGYVVHLAEERRYGLGVAAHELGSAYTRQAPLQRIARPVLNRLVDATGVNGHFAALHGADVVYLIEERAPRRPPLVTDVGVRLPAQLTASGLAMLAALSTRQVRALYPNAEAFVLRHDAGPRTPAQLKQLLVETRRDGYARERGSVTPGLASVAAAVIDHSGHPAGAVALTFDERGEGDDPDRVRWLGKQVVQAAGGLAERLRS